MNDSAFRKWVNMIYYLEGNMKQFKGKNIKTIEIPKKCLQIKEKICNCITWQWRQ